MKLKTQPTIFTILQRDKSANAELLNVLELNETTLLQKREGYNAWKDRLDRAETEQKVIKNCFNNLTIVTSRSLVKRKQMIELSQQNLTPLNCKRMQTAIRHTP